MKCRLDNIGSAISSLLLVLVLVAWTLSYRHSAYLQHRDTTWSGYSHSTASYGAGFKRGRFLIHLSQHTTNMDMYSAEKWATVPPDGQERLLAYKARLSEFHGWDREWSAIFARPLVETLRESILGLEWDKLVTPSPGSGTIIFIPTWLVAAILAIPGARWFGRRRNIVAEDLQQGFGQPACA